MWRLLSKRLEGLRQGTTSQRRRTLRYHNLATAKGYQRLQASSAYSVLGAHSAVPLDPVPVHKPPGDSGGACNQPYTVHGFRCRARTSSCNVRHVSRISNLARAVYEDSDGRRQSSAMLLATDAASLPTLPTMEAAPVLKSNWERGTWHWRHCVTVAATRDATVEQLALSDVTVPDAKWRC